MTTLLDYALCTVADVKENLGIASGDSTKNNLIIRKINQATEMIEKYCGRRFKASDYTEYYNGTLTDQLVLRQRPINTVTSIGRRSTTLNDDDFTDLASDEYFIDANAGLIDAVANFYSGYQRWKIVYNAGYTTIPSDLAEACATLASWLVQNGTGSFITTLRSKEEGARRLQYNQPTPGSSLIEQLGLDAILNEYSNTIISGL